MIEINEMTIKTENPDGTIDVVTTVCYSDDQLAADRAHYRSLAPRGAVQTIEVWPVTR